MASGAARMIPERRTVRETVNPPAPVTPTESQIATVAHQLWLDRGCPLGSDQEDWFQAEAMLKNALATECEDLSRRPSIPRYETGAESEISVELWWEGHWEVWESEWGGARWIRDSRPSRR